MPVSYYYQKIIYYFNCIEYFESVFLVVVILGIWSNMPHTRLLPPLLQEFRKLYRIVHILLYILLYLDTT